MPHKACSAGIACHCQNRPGLLQEFHFLPPKIYRKRIPFNRKMECHAVKLHLYFWHKRPNEQAKHLNEQTRNSAVFFHFTAALGG